MPVFNFTIPDSSPLIIYSGPWNDTQPYKTSNYIDGKYHVTGDNSATATLRFFGSGIYVFGTQRPEHGNYRTTLDGVMSTGDAHGDSVLVNQPLFSTNSLNSTEAHEFTLQNYATDPTQPTTVDIDSVIITTGDGNPQTQSIESVWDDGHPNITYTGGWTNVPNELANFYHNNTLHITCGANAAAHILFMGNAVEVYGATSSNHGSFYAIMDGGAPLMLNGHAPEFRAQMLLFYANGLSGGLHNLTIANAPGRLCIDIDNVVISRWSVDATLGKPQTSFTPTQSTQSSSSSSLTQESTASSRPVSHSHVGAIAGGVVAAVAGAVLLGLALVLWIHRHRRSSQIICPFPYETVPVIRRDRSPKLLGMLQENGAQRSQGLGCTPRAILPGRSATLSRPPSEQPPRYNSIGIAM